ncbi:winged helix-turn-helix domain-containing protein [uncultured Pedobacter sp.]|uniref:winged helix-turn-helix domain-containing protein n=1 Tax=uncultured Pedobacter sp. TaxID=246139 RepID=UPI0025D643B3|nr:winged helix-turn-helix domain-containing protein [uncultured Pedobacter sp.]
MQLSQNLFTGKSMYLFGALLLLSFIMIFAAFSISDNDNFQLSRREVLFRRIGDELLLQSGDSISRVLPIKKVAENEYQIQFEHEFSFNPITLVNTTKRLLANDPMTGDYVVKVIDINDSSTVYGYAIAHNKKDEIIACIGRKQPKAQYMINIQLKPTGIITKKHSYLLGSLPFLAFVGFIFFRSVKPRKALPNDDEHHDLITLSTVLFDAKNRKLTLNKDTIALTGTETRLLLIFAQSPNETIERSRLQKEIWEDEGIIVGRSLDMFISKLRKKLAPDPNINIIVVRAKGYKLEIKG